MTVIKRETEEAAHAVWWFGKSYLEEIIAEPRLKKMKTLIDDSNLEKLHFIFGNMWCENWLIQGILTNTGKGWIIGECGRVG